MCSDNWLHYCILLSEGPPLGQEYQDGVCVWGEDCVAGWVYLQCGNIQQKKAEMHQYTIQCTKAPMHQYTNQQTSGDYWFYV